MDHRKKQRRLILGAGAREFSEERSQLVSAWFTLRCELEALQGLAFEVENLAFAILDKLEEERGKPIEARVV